MPRDDMDRLSDEALLALYAQGDGMAARALTGRLLPRAMGYAGRMLGDRAEAEDVAQEAMLRLWRAAPGWRAGEAQVATWLYRVVTNLCLDRLRRRVRQGGQAGGPMALEEAPDVADAAPGVEAGLIEAERMAALDAALAKLPERQRQALELRHFEGLSNPEIAEVMDIGVEAVESLTARAKRALTALLAARRGALGYGEGA